MTAPESLQASVESALGRAVAFLRGAQLPHGEFRSLIGSDMQMSNAEFDSSPFVTTFVVYALSQIDGEPAADVAERALDFLEREMEFGGVWRYYSSLQYKHCRIPPDLDDTACATYALRSGGRAVPDNGWIVRHCRDASGRFLTWVVHKPGLAWTPRFWFVRTVGAMQAELARRAAPRPKTAIDPGLLTTRRDPIAADDVDPVVNANVILLLGECKETAPAVQYLIELIRAGPPARFSLYYQDVLALYYMVARAHQHSAPALAVLGDKIADEVVSRQHSDGSFGNPLSTALAASALLTFAPQAPVLRGAVASILRWQRDDGAWDMRPFYCAPPDFFWASDELTTAFCIEVLARYRKSLMGERDSLQGANSASGEGGPA
jgi:hypothetical protein